MQFFETRSSKNQLEYPCARIELLFWLTYFYIHTQQNLFKSLCKERKKHLLWLSTRYSSLPPRYFCSTFDRVLKNIQIPLKEVQLKSMNGKTIFIDTHFFSIGNIHQLNNRLLTEIYNAECLHISSIKRSLGIPRAVFKSYYAGLLQYKIFVEIAFFNPVS